MLCMKVKWICLCQKRGRCPVQWGEIPCVCLYVSPGWLALRLLQLSLRPLQLALRLLLLALRSLQLALRSLQLALRPHMLALRPLQLALRPAGLKTQFLPILHDFVPS